MAASAEVAVEAGPEGTLTFFADVRDKAVIFQGDEECSTKTGELFAQMGLPEGLLPLKDIIEGGYVEETGFSWTIARGQQEHHFEKAERICAYDEVVTSVISPGKMSDIHGVKAKEFGIWVPVNEILVDESDPQVKKLIFKSILGLSRAIPFDLFV